VGASLEDLGKGLRSTVGTMFGTVAKGVRCLETAEGYVTRLGIDENNEVVGYEFIHLGKMMESIHKGVEPAEALKKATSKYGRFDEAKKAINHHEGVDVSITGNSTNPTRFQHPVPGTYRKECALQGKKYFSVASGGGTGRTLHPDSMAAGPASYGVTDTMGRMHSDAQFAGSSSVPAHVEMMGFLGMGNNPMIGASVAVAVALEQAQR
jgi:hypothetical protein